MNARLLALLTILGLSLSFHTAIAQEEPAKMIRAGMIGLDTSHVPAFTKIFNNPKATGDLAGIRIVAGYPGGTDIPASRDRVGKFTEQLRGMDVEIVDSIPKLLEKVDVVLLESVDGRIHLQEAIPVIKAGKPLFIDKPVAGSLVDAIVIYELAKAHNVPCFSSSSTRFGPWSTELKANEELGELAGAAVWGPCSYQEGTPDLFFYGIHGVESLFTMMGTGCETVARVQAPDADVVTGVWKGGRVGTYRGIRRNKAAWGAVVYGTKGIVPAGKGGNYEDLCGEIGKFFKTGKPPVSAEETIEIFAFLEAADVSKARKGVPVSLADVLAKAKAEAAGETAVANHAASRPAISLSPRLIFVAVMVPAACVAIDHWLLSTVSTSQSIPFTALLLTVFVVQVGVVGVLCARLIESPILRAIIYAWSWVLIDLQTIVATTLVSMSNYYGVVSATILTKSLFAAQLGLVTIWALLGVTWWVFRLPAALVLAALLAVPLSDEDFYRGEQGSMFFVQTVILAAICGVLRWQGYRVDRPDSTSESLAAATLRGTQFGLRHVLIWMTSLAVVLAIARAFGLLSAERYIFGGLEWVWLFSSGVAASIVLIVALWAALGSGPSWLRLLLLIAIAPTTGLVLSVTEYQVRQRTALIPSSWWDMIEYEWWIIAWVCLAGGLLYAALLFYRTLGYRLARAERSPLGSPSGASRPLDVPSNLV